MPSETAKASKVNTPKRVYLLLGSNQGDRRHQLLTAVHHLQTECGKVAARSHMYETEPWGLETEELSFYNQAIALDTSLPPGRLMQMCLQIERKMGRKRRKYVSSRPIDIDILLYDDLIVRQKNCTIPHPRLHLRRFAMIPLLEINPDLSHPEFKIPIAQLLEKCTDKLQVTKLETISFTT